MDSVLFYAGSFNVQGNLVRHQVLNATDPNRIGKEMIRDAQLDSDGTLRLVARGEFGVATLAWVKI